MISGSALQVQSSSEAMLAADGRHYGYSLLAHHGYGYSLGYYGPYRS